MYSFHKKESFRIILDIYYFGYTVAFEENETKFEVMKYDVVMFSMRKS